jgi:hypothetical protein
VVKSHKSQIEYEKHEPSALSDRNPDIKKCVEIDPSKMKAPRMTSLSNKSNNLTDENPFKHMLDSPLHNRLLKTRKDQVGIIKEICSINQQILH